MPKVKNPLMSMEARGGIGGLVYNTWRGINTVKTNTSPTGQGTAKRLAAQALLAYVSQLWRALTDAQRAAWNQYAIDHPVSDWTGSPKRLTGMNWFVDCCIANRRAGVAVVTAPPVLPQPAAPVGLALSKLTTDLKVTWTTPSSAAIFVDLWLAGPLSAGRSPKIEQAKALSVMASNIVKPATLLAGAAIGRYTCFARTLDGVEGLQSTWVSAYLDFT